MVKKSTEKNTSSDAAQGKEIPLKDPTKSISFHSCVSKEEYSHTWKINDFSAIPFSKEYPLYSIGFTIRKSVPSTFQIVLTKHYYRENEKEGELDPVEHEEAAEGIEVLKESHEKNLVKPKKPEFKSPPKKRIGLRLTKSDDNELWDAIEYSFTLKTSDGNTLQAGKRTDPGIDDLEQDATYIYVTEEHMKERDLFKEKELDIICDVTYFHQDASPSKIPKTCEAQKFSEDLKVLLTNHKFADVAFDVNGTEMLAHKNILWARAIGFENLLKKDKGGIEDKKDTAVKDTDVKDKDVKDKNDIKEVLDLELDPSVAEALVHYIYCFKIMDGFPVEKCPELQEAAKKWGVHISKNELSEYFKVYLDPSVCKECLRIDKDTKDCLESIKKHDPETLERIYSKKPCPHMTKKDA